MGTLFYLTLVVLVVVPLFKLLPRYGLNALWSLVAVLPLGLIALLWIMAARADRLSGTAPEGLSGTAPEEKG